MNKLAGFLLFWVISGMVVDMVATTKMPEKVTGQKEYFKFLFYGPIGLLKKVRQKIYPECPS